MDAAHGVCWFGVGFVWSVVCMVYIRTIFVWAYNIIRLPGATIEKLGRGRA